MVDSGKKIITKDEDLAKFAAKVEKAASMVQPSNSDELKIYVDIVTRKKALRNSLGIDKCPLCEKECKASDFTGLDLKEWYLSGYCHSCQDVVFSGFNIK